MGNGYLAWWENFGNSIVKGAPHLAEDFGDLIVHAPENIGFTAKVAGESTTKFFKDPDNIGKVFDGVPIAGGTYRCAQVIADEVTDHKEKEDFHTTMCAVDQAATAVTLASLGTAAPEASLSAVGARVAAEEAMPVVTEEAIVTEETSAVAAKPIPHFHPLPQLTAVAAAPFVFDLAHCKELGKLTPHCKSLAKQEAEERAEEQKKLNDAWTNYLVTDTYTREFDKQGIWDVDFRPKKVPDLVPQEEDEPVLAHDVVPPTLEPDLRMIQQFPSAPQSSSATQRVAAVVLTSVLLYAAYSAYVSA